MVLKRSSVSGIASQRFISAFSDSTIGAGVPPGRKAPNQAETSNGLSSDMVSRIGISSGAVGLRWAEVMASAPDLVKPTGKYVLKPGDSHFYDVGMVHSPKRDTVTKLVRIEDANLDHIKRSNIKAA
jgi:hypothetical protein